MINFERLNLPYVDYRNFNHKVFYEIIKPKLVEIMENFGTENMVGSKFRVVAVGKDDVILDVEDEKLGWDNRDIGSSYYLYAPYYVLKE